jgi:HPt (histidine-containing phosphotransfer) domain-containing protein
MIRTAERKQRQAVNAYSQQVRQYNAEVEKAKRQLKRDVDAHNAAVRKEQREIDAYNRKAEAHNRRVRQDRQRLINELRKLERQPATVQFVPLETSVRVLNEVYERVDVESDSWGSAGVALADLAEAETANSAAAANALHGGDAEEIPEGTVITDELLVISEDLDMRWRGALFSLNARNPDAARHFCTSAREILTRVIDQEAPDTTVLNAVPDCEKLKNGKPVRRAKIGYLLAKSGADYESLREFVDTDVDDVVQLINLFSDATHGEAGVFDLPALRALKQRVEGAIRLLSAIVRPARAAEAA